MDTAGVGTAGETGASRRDPGDRMALHAAARRNRAYEAPEIVAAFTNLEGRLASNVHTSRRTGARRGGDRKSSPDRRQPIGVQQNLLPKAPKPRIP
jgi:hypothetical protein